MTTKPNVGSTRSRRAEAAKPQVDDPENESVEGDVYEMLESVKTELENVQVELKDAKREISSLYSRQDKDRNSFREFKEQIDLISDEEVEEDGSTGGTGAFDTAQVLKDLDTSDPQIKVLAARKYNSEADFYAALGKHYAKQPNSNSAQETSSPAKGKTGIPREDEMVGELTTLYRNPTGHEDRIKELETTLEW